MSKGISQIIFFYDTILSFHSFNLFYIFSFLFLKILTIFATVLNIYKIIIVQNIK